MKKYAGKHVIALLIGILLIVNTSRISAQQKTALVLSGGGARGFAHIGVIKALEELGFYPDIIVGTSIGAIIGGLYACGNSVEVIEHYIEKTDWQDLFTRKSYRVVEMASQKMGEIPALFSLRIDREFNFIIPKYLLSTQGLQERFFPNTIYAEYQANQDFDSLAIPLRIVATDIKTGQSVVLRSGNIAKTIIGSSAFPVVLSPVPEDSLLLVDGGLTNNVPCDVARQLGADFIVAVDMSSRKAKLGENMNPLMYMGQTINTLAYFSDTRHLHLADVLIRPAVDHIYSTDFDSLETLINAGYQETIQKREQLLPGIKNNPPDPNYYQQAVKALNKATIQEINYRGNNYTREFILSRELVLNPGEEWSLSAAKGSIKNLYSTELFNLVSVSVLRKAPDTAQMTIEVEEKERFLFSFGANYDSEKETRAFLSAKYRNLFGMGINNNFYLIAGDQFQRLAWDIRSPRIFETNLTNYMSLYYQHENLPLYQQGKQITTGRFSRWGFEINGGINIRRVGLTSLGFKYEYMAVQANEDYTTPIENQTYGIGRIIGRIIVENTDDYDLPTQGHSNNIFYEHSLQGNALRSFSKLYVNSIGFETFRDKYTFATHMRFGYLNSALSHFEKFRFGGVHSFPGYHQDEKWGKLLLAMGLGLRMPITTGLYWRTLGLFGNIWDSLEDFNWQELNFGIRTGLLLMTPVGPISIDYGQNLNGRRLTYFSIGHSF